MVFSFYITDGYAPFLSMSLRESFLTVKDHVVAAPGPGTYNPKIYDHINGSSTLANRSQRFQEKFDETPGPGSYDLSKASDWIKNKHRLQQFEVDFGVVCLFCCLFSHVDTSLQNKINVTLIYKIFIWWIVEDCKHVKKF